MTADINPTAVSGEGKSGGKLCCSAIALNASKQMRPHGSASSSLAFLKFTFIGMVFPEIRLIGFGKVSRNSPLTNGGAPKALGGCPMIFQDISQIRKTTPRQLRDRCRHA